MDATRLSPEDYGARMWNETTRKSTPSSSHSSSGDEYENQRKYSAEQVAAARQSQPNNRQLSDHLSRLTLHARNVGERLDAFTERGDSLPVTPNATDDHSQRCETCGVKPAAMKAKKAFIDAAYKDLKVLKFELIRERGEWEDFEAKQAMLDSRMKRHNHERTDIMERRKEYREKNRALRKREAACDERENKRADGRAAKEARLEKAEREINARERAVRAMERSLNKEFAANEAMLARTRPRVGCNTLDVHRSTNSSARQSDSPINYFTTQSPAPPGASLGYNQITFESQMVQVHDSGALQVDFSFPDDGPPVHTTATTVSRAVSAAIDSAGRKWEDLVCTDDLRELSGGDGSRCVWSTLYRDAGGWFDGSYGYSCKSCQAERRLCLVYIASQMYLLPLSPEKRSTEDAKNIGYWIMTEVTNPQKRKRGV
ncbi:hypothetical protein EJ05DRAFT_487961 [Pseudovirgaria hyperparasitica]|uniref:Uncharacterized protein n=1 Tax=Pseudovirgaria hyperparasitica TaxID=470096 RepID=A0A6A6W0U3_9PEZI|nr:uncharacterized protein EJ05DRAFT_487961 [Pseudovirgaria hyperparasitica]KAF2756163.1 hypothetical protein EJ05DRAFT_487961 [Pseudovirgaria hyperparasitica]